MNIRALLTLLACLALTACGKGSTSAPPGAPAPQRDPMVVTAPAELAARLLLGAPAYAEVRETIRAPARVDADETRLARVGAPVAGRIVDLVAREGDNVRRGQVLARINSTELSAAQLGYLKALSQAGLAERATARARQLFEADVISAAELQRRQAELVQAQAEADAMGDQLKVLGMSEAGQSKLAATRSINSVAYIVATLSGTVIDRKVTEGQVVQPADGVFLVADLSSVWVVADIPEQAAGSVRVGESVTVEIPALPGRRIEGRLSYLSPTVNPQTRTVRVRMDVPNPERDLKPAMLASMLIQGPPQRRLTIDAAAIVREDNRDFVFVRTAGDAWRLTPVQLGDEAQGRRVVLSGLRDADAVVLDGAFHLNNERRRRELGGS